MAEVQAREEKALPEESAAMYGEPFLTTEEALEERLSRPTPGVLRTLERIEGDIAVLGVGGKMGPTLARMIVRGDKELGKTRRVTGVARFSCD